MTGIRKPGAPLPVTSPLARAPRLTELPTSLPSTFANVTGGWVPGRTTCRPHGTVADPVASRKFDGYLVGAGGRMLEPGASLDTVSTVSPAGRSPKGTALFVNGMLNNIGDQTRAMQDLANTTGYAIAGVHNATGGSALDLSEAIGQKLALRTPESVKTTARLVLAELDAGKPVALLAHSQGGLVLSQSLTLVRDTLLKRGQTKEQVEARLSTIDVTTFGAAANSYPDGPRYTHVSNRHDPVAKLASVNLKPGKGAKVVWFNDEAKESGGGALAGHLLSTYLKFVKKNEAEPLK